MINRTQQSDGRLIAALKQATALVPTWIQTMAVHPFGRMDELGKLIQEALAAGATPKGVLLYGMRRPSHQPGGEGLRTFSEPELEEAAKNLRAAIGLSVRVFP